MNKILDDIINKWRIEREVLSRTPSDEGWENYENVKQFVLDLQPLKIRIEETIQYLQKMKKPCMYHPTHFTDADMLDVIIDKINNI